MLAVKIIASILILSLLSCSSSLTGSTVPEVDTSIDWTLQFDGSGKGILENPSFTESNVDYGQKIAVGDYNGDGIMDVATSAILTDIHPSNSGSVLIYYGSSDQFTTDDLSPDVRLESPGQADDRFGSALFTTDNNKDGVDDLVVGAHLTNRGGSDQGVVYFYYGATTGLATSPGQVVDQPESDPSDGFGTDIVIGDLDKDGFDELIVGSMYGDIGGADRGTVWIIQGQSNGVYNIASYVRINHGAALDNDNFGHSVALFDYDNDSNLDLFIGAPRDDDAGADQGAIHIFLGNATPGSFVNSTTVPDVTIASTIPASSGSFLGTDIDFADIDNDGTTDMIVGASFADVGGADNGSVRIYQDIRSSVVEDAFILQPNTILNVGNRWGHAVTVADVNSDGAQDLLVSAPTASDYGTNVGKIHAFHGSLSGNWDLITPEKTYANYAEQLNRSSYNHNFGSSACLLDYNRDGIKDLVIGDRFNDDLSFNQGTVYVYFMSSDGTMMNRPDVRIQLSPNATNAFFGASCTVMDFNRDGDEDLVIGAAGQGQAYVYYGSSTGLATSPSITITDPGAGASFGSSMTSGDINNDGFGDLIIGDDQFDGAGTDRGRVYIYESNNVTGLISPLAPTVFGDGAVNSDAYGRGLAVIDYDGDSDNELIVGIPGDDTLFANSGSITIYDNPGTPNTVLTTATPTVVNNPGAATNDNFGGYIYVGNYSSNTFPDLFVSAMYDDISGVDAGVTYHYLGSASGITGFIDSTFRALDPSVPVLDELGSGVITHDFNQDGVMDLGIGARADDLTGFNSGTYYILLN